MNGAGPNIGTGMKNESRLPKVGEPMGVNSINSVVVDATLMNEMKDKI